MSRPSTITRVTLRRVAGAPSLLLAEVGDGRWTGLATAPDRPGLAEAVGRRGAGLIGRSADHGPGPGPGEGDWLRDDADWTAFGLLESARHDLAARRHDVPLWRWLGGAVRRAVGVSGPAEEQPAGAGGPRVMDPSRWSELGADLLADRVDGLRVDPLRVGGPAGVLRIDAIARTFRVGLALASGSTLTGRALAVHLAMAATMATLPLRWTGGDAPDQAWLGPTQAYRPDGGRVIAPEAAGLGLAIDAGRLEPLVAERWSLGEDDRG
jgi:L-alanine-DL-glutamate epimerase-like enolase superfamily enzyme